VWSEDGFGQRVARSEVAPNKVRRCKVNNKRDKDICIVQKLKKGNIRSNKLITKLVCD